MGKLYILVIVAVLCFAKANSQDKVPFISTYSSQHGIPPLKITKMATDSAGYLWIGSNLGLHRFNGNNLRTFNEIPRTIIGDIEVHPDGTVMIALLSEGIALLDPMTDEFEILAFDEVFMFDTGQNFDFFVKDDGRVFMTHNGAGLFEFHKETKTVTRLVSTRFINAVIQHPLDTGKLIILADSLYAYNLDLAELEIVSSKKLLDFVVDDSNDLWYITYDDHGIFKLSWKDEEDVYFPVKGGYKPYLDRLIFKNNSIWIAAEMGLYQFDIEDKSWQLHFQSEGPTSALYNDNLDRLWFGQDNKLKVLDPLSQYFTLVPNSTGKNYSSIAHIALQKYLLAPFNGSELEIYNAADNSLISYELEKKLQFLAFPFDMVKIDDQIFISYGTGVGRFNCSTETMEEVKFNQYNDYFRRGYKKRFYTDTNGTLWIDAINNYVLFKVNPRNLEIDSIHYYKPPGEIGQDVHITQEGRILLKTNLGLYDIDFNSGGTKLLPFIYKGENIDLGYIEKLAIDKQELWLIARGSIYIGEIKNSKVEIVKQIENQQGYFYNLKLDVQSFNADEKVVLTSAGVEFYDKDSENYKFFGMEDGLVNADRRLRLKIFDDRLFFLSDGIVHAQKSKLDNIKRETKVTIDLFEVQGENLVDENSIRIAPGDNDVKIQFKSIDLTKPLDVKYKYRISEDDPWIYGDYDDNEIYLLDLKAGDYLFEVSSKHRFSNWSEAKRLEFTIDKPFWKSLWFMLFSIGFLLLVSYLIYRSRLANIRKLSAMKTRMVQLENEALRAQMNPHFIFNSLNSIKSYIIEHEKEEAADYLTDFSDLIRLILSNSREQQIPIKKEIEALKLYMDIENVRLENKFTYSINNEVDNCLIQPLTLQPFIENAIWHGFIHKAGIGHLKIDIKRNRDTVTIEIEDDGVGRKKSHEVEKKHKRKRSFGILITKERLAQSLEGENIEIVDLVNETGTLVRITIPYVKAKDQAL